MITLEYHPDLGMACRDGECAQLALTYAYNAKIGRERHFIHSTENIFLAVRVLVRNGAIGCNLVNFKFGNTIIAIDSNGRCHPWPNGFCEYTQARLLELL